MSKNIETILVLGFGGTMGNGIAQVAAQAGFKVRGYDLEDKYIDKGMSSIKSSLSRMDTKGKLGEQKMEDILENITTTTNLSEVTSGVDFVIEAVFEDLEVKSDLYSKLEELIEDHVIIASNTSTISISLLAGTTSRQDRFVGMHFFNPVPVMNLIEIISGLSTSDETLEMTRKVGERLGKEIIVSKDSPGFIVNRILIPMLMEAIFALDEGVGTVEDIDKGIMLGLGHPMGPFKLLDLVGLDTALHVAESFQEGFMDSKYRVPHRLRRMVSSGKLGKKSGEGFYSYK